ncbi:MAG: hypothetical protein AAGA76_01460 [Pseudomonadota bacterium]
MRRAKVCTPVRERGTVAVMVHAFRAKADSDAALHLATCLAEAGIASLRFSFTDDTDRRGVKDPLQFSDNIEELVFMAEYARGNLGVPRLLIGHSLDGVAVLAASQHIPEIVAIATIGVPADPAGVAHLYDPDSASGNLYMDTVHDTLLSSQLTHIKKPYLILHAPEDGLVAIRHGINLFHAAQFPKAFVSLDGCDHSLKEPRDARYAGRVIARWAERFIFPESLSASEPVT